MRLERLAYALMAAGAMTAISGLLYGIWTSNDVPSSFKLAFTGLAVTIAGCVVDLISVAAGD